MLKQLTIRNYVLVDALDVSFNAGLTGITGESGAGKSILLGALSLLLGERAKTDCVRPGADKADISAEFELLPSGFLQTKLAADELLEDGDTHCLVRRVISAEGRSRSFINSIPVTLQYLKDISEHLVDIQGQNEHQRLLDRNVQRSLLDDYGKLTSQSKKVSQLYKTWQSTVQEISKLQEIITAHEDRKTLLKYQLEEFENLSIGENELAQLELEQKRLAQAQSILEILSRANGNLEELDDLRQTARMLSELDDSHQDLTVAKDTLISALALLDDAARDLRRYQDQVVVDPSALEEIDERISAILEVARKHKIQPERVSSFAEELQQEFDNMASDTTLLDRLTTKESALEAEFLTCAKKLSTARRKQSGGFCKDVNKYIQALGIKDGALSIVFHDQQSEHGLEQVEFHVTTNANFAAGPLGRIASGGEQTRISLAIQIVAAANSALPCLVLDEADVGVGGTTADTVGRILRDLADHTQVLCVTHAPQVAALGHNHMRVSKHKDQTVIEPLSQDNRIEELARMLAGADVTEKTRAYATTLLQEAHPK
jgi:DNA repair protein RecN (Recombination protein N)